MPYFFKGFPNYLINMDLPLETFLIAYYNENIKRAIAHKVVSLVSRLNAYLARLSTKVGIFIFACYSYLCRQAMR